MKIITFTKNNQFQALLQFNDPSTAQQAKIVSSPRDDNKYMGMIERFSKNHRVRATVIPRADLS